MLYPWAFITDLQSYNIIEYALFWSFECDKVRAAKKNVIKREQYKDIESATLVSLLENNKNIKIKKGGRYKTLSQNAKPDGHGPHGMLQRKIVCQSLFTLCLRPTFLNLNPGSQSRRICKIPQNKIRCLVKTIFVLCESFLCCMLIMCGFG